MSIIKGKNPLLGLEVAALAALALAMSRTNQRRRPPPTPEQQARIAQDNEIGRWNAAVDARKAEKQQAKLRRRAQEQTK